MHDAHTLCFMRHLPALCRMILRLCNRCARSNCDPYCLHPYQRVCACTAFSVCKRPASLALTGHSLSTAGVRAVIDLAHLGPQLTYGLSTEYTNKPSSEGKEKVDADRDVFAKYYVNQILSMDESGIKDAWHKVRDSA